MIASFLITFRETLEAALVIGIVLSYLTKIRQKQYNKIVYVGIILAILLSITGAFLFESIEQSFSGRGEEIFEGTVMLIGAFLLSTMILWMLKQKNITKELQEKVAIKISKAEKIGLFSLVFIAVLREGIETVIFLNAASLVSVEKNIIGASLGIIVAIFLGYLLFLTSVRVDIKKFFNITSILLILFAAGLVAQGIHELQEAKVIGTSIEHLYDINPSLNPDGSYPALHEKGSVGNILKGLFGYNGNPSLEEVIAYIIYIIFIVIIWAKLKSKKVIKRISS